MISNSDIVALTAFRRDLHQHPELSGEEEKTAATIAKALQGLHPDDLRTDVGGHGVLAIFKGEGAADKTLMLRCELDGLPILEVNTFDHRSKHEGKGHLCGHDGHMAIIMGVARQLSRKRRRGLNVMLLFQPAEETGAGARAVLDDPQFRDIAPDFSASMHNMPGMDLGHISLAAGAVNCASRGLRITLKGRTAHASQPETGLSPLNAMATIMTGLNTMSYGMPEDREAFRMATVTHAEMGECTFGVAPADAEVWVTLRTLTDTAMAELCHKAEALVNEQAAQTGLSVSMVYDDVFHACTNDEIMTKIMSEAFEMVGISTSQAHLPLRWSEDFGLFSEVSHAAMFFLGSGQGSPALHNPDYDFPDDLIAIGIRAFMEIIEKTQLYIYQE